MKTQVLSGSGGSRLRSLKFMGGKQPISAVKQTISGYLTSLLPLLQEK
jgi:hypothetical protein